MSEDLFVHHCAPTLAGLKTGSLFACGFESESEMKNTVRAVNRRLKSKGLRFVPMKYSGKKALLYLYRPDKLRLDLKCSGANAILSGCGYSTEHPGKCISCLRRKLSQSEEFPHEIGLFLGYPPDDVKGFIEQGAKNCKCSGCWKVYGDEKLALSLFVKYKKCREIYCRKHAEGFSLERLAVAAKQ
ncbi:MAG: DUF3793 family protein [Clostridia bacterium]|nr:DUF3793 family protein [Clostridia bacterium]